MKWCNLKFIFSLYFVINVSNSFSQNSSNYFTIKVVDDRTGRGVPLAELKTTNQICYYTDNNGIIAFQEPDLMGDEVFFHIKSHGYEYPSDGFGYHGKAFRVVPGDSVQIRIKRINVAERLYRITGEGLFHHSQLLGIPVPVKPPLPKGKVMGQDTFIETFYNGKIYWFWGDTDKPSYPLGNFSTSGAVSELPGKGGLDPSIGIDLTYFTDESGFSKKMCPLPDPGLVWMHWLTTIKDEKGSEKLIGSYTRVKTLGVAWEQGLALFNDSAELFEPIVRFEPNSPLFPEGHSFRAFVNGKEYLYFSFATPYSLRVQADLKHLSDLSAYEAFTCLPEGTRYDTTKIQLDRDINGHLNYGWKKNTHPLDAEKEQYMIRKGYLKPDETWLNLHDLITGKTIMAHSGSVFWNAYRKKWIMIMEEKFGTSAFGEVWYAEGDTPAGPWVYARKIVTHDNYTFYNVGQHPLFDQENGKLIYFEGTYTNSFSGNPEMTPRYNYNQIMYRLNLADSGLYLPAPVYRVKDQKTKLSYHLRETIDSLDYWNRVENIPFFAIPPNRSFDGLIPVFAEIVKGKTRLRTSHGKQNIPLFYALPVSDPTLHVIDGTWECLADNYPITMEIKVTGNKVKGTISNENLVIEKGSFIADSIELIVTDTLTLESYLLKARISKGTLTGEYKGLNNDDQGKLTGNRLDEYWKKLFTPMVVPLYEFTDPNGSYFYSVNDEMEGMIRLEKPVCNVWRNPSTLMTLDYNAKPVRMIK